MRVPRRAARALAAIALGACGGVHAEGAEQLGPLFLKEPITIEAGYTWDDNVNRGRDSETRRHDGIFGVAASHGRNWLLAPTIRGEVTALANGEAFSRYSGLSRVSAGLQATAQYRGSGAYDATTFGVTGRAQYDHFKSDVRRGPRYFIGVNAERAITDRIDVTAEIGTGARYGRSEVFRGREHSAKVNVGYSLRTAGTLYAMAEYRKGDAVSGGGPSLVNIDLASVLVPDDAFGATGQFSYRFDARTVLATLGWNYPLGPRAALDLSWRHVRTTPTGSLGFEAQGGLRYLDNQYSVTYLRRF